MTQTAYLSLGSNLNDRAAHLAEAIQRLQDIGKVKARSSLYETEPMEIKNQPWFLNCAIGFENGMTPQKLLKTVLAIEHIMGRQRLLPKGPRIIDIDILLFGDHVESSATLTVPHPALHRRRFVLEPLAEIAPDVRHPVLKKTVREMLESLPLSDDGTVRKLRDLNYDSSVEIDEIAVLLRPFAHLNHHQLAATLTYIDLLQNWNARVNLTAVRNPLEIVTRHFGESFFAAQTLLGHDYRGDIIDLGSGAGFPGVPIAMFATDARVTLIESNSKKVAFLNEVIRALELRNASVFNHRAEEYSDRASVVVMRAVEKFTASLSTASALVRRGGRLALMIGQGQVEQARTLLPDWQWQEPIMAPECDSRVLLVGTH